MRQHGSVVPCIINIGRTLKSYRLTSSSHFQLFDVLTPCCRRSVSAVDFLLPEKEFKEEEGTVLGCLFCVFNYLFWFMLSHTISSEPVPFLFGTGYCTIP